MTLANAPDVCDPRRGARPPSVDDITAILRRDIISLRLRVDERLSENDVALRFGTSRTPVREAFIRLAEQGLVEVRPQRGTFVSSIPLRTVQSAAFVRAALESALAYAAAEKGLSPTDLDIVHTALAHQEALRDDPEGFMRADDAFHAGLAAAVDRREVWTLIDREKAPLDRLRYLDVEQVTAPDAVIAQHRAILDAVCRRDADGAASLMRDHIVGILSVAAQLAKRLPTLLR